MSEAKVYVIHENLEWTQHLVKWLEELEVPYELWDLSSGILDLQSPPPQGIFYNRMSASSHKRTSLCARVYRAGDYLVGGTWTQGCEWYWSYQPRNQ